MNVLVLSGDTKVGKWLENPLTAHGLAYVRERIHRDPEKKNPVVQFWAKVYAEVLSL